MQKLSSFGQGKKFRPKKSLTSLLHAALQLKLSLPDSKQLLKTKLLNGTDIKIEVCI